MLNFDEGPPKIRCKEIYILMCQTDMTEGRGPYAVHSVWGDRKEAEKYMDSMPGVMGRKVQWSKEKCGDWVLATHKVLYVAADANGELRRQQAMAKLTDEDKKILGLG